MPKLMLCVGVSNCGKSEYTKQYIKQNPNTVELNRDSIRYDTTQFLDENGRYNRNAYNEEHVHEIMLNNFHIAARQSKDIIISDTNLYSYTRNKWIELASRHGYTIEYIVFNTAFNNIFYSAESNLYKLPDYVLKKQYKLFTMFLEEYQNPKFKYKLV